MRANVLIIEDENKIARLLESDLTHAGYKVELSKNGREGLEKMMSRMWDVVLLNSMLSEPSGLEVLKSIRISDQITPVILFAERDAAPDKISALDLGANDYITEPFEIAEVLARIRSCLRNRRIGELKQEPGVQTILKIADLKVNLITREIDRAGISIELTLKEFDLLVYLIKHQNQVLTRERIINQVWGYDFLGDTNIVDVYIRYLRKKIDYPYKVQLIQTHRGVGYCIKENN